MRTLLTQLTRFGLVGTIGLVIDVGVFNLLRVTVLSPEALHEGPVVAKIISTSLAIVANWMGNRHWTFARERRGHLGREGVEFFVVSFGGMLIGLACLWVSHYLLEFDSLLADNISSNVIGLALGTAFRFWGYRVWVFREVSVPRSPSARPTDAAHRSEPATWAQARLVTSTGSVRRSTSSTRFYGSTRLSPVAELVGAHAASLPIGTADRRSASVGTGDVGPSSAGLDELDPPYKLDPHMGLDPLYTALRAAEGSVAPVGGAPAHRIQAVAPVDDDARRHD